MKKITKAITRYPLFIVNLYRPARSTDHRGNFTWLLAMLIAYPSTFLKPTFSLFMKTVRLRTKGAALALLMALVHTLISPFIVLYLIVLPFLGCRLYAHTPAGQVLSEIELMIAAQQRQ